MNWILLTPELTLLLAAALFLVMSCLKPDPQRDYRLAVSMAAVTVAAGIACSTMSGDLFNHVYRVDLFSQVFKTLISIGFFLVIFLCDDFQGVAPSHHGEGYFLLAVCTLSMMMLASAVHLLAIVLALELSSYSLYILVFLRRDGRWGMITGLHYFLVGASASAIMLFGLALIYGVTGAVLVDMLIQRLPAMMDRPLVVTGLLLTLAGFFFKLAVFPFHFWAPEAYQGAPNPVAAFIAAVSKVAAVAILLRMISLAQGNSDLLARGLIAMAVVSMTVGNLAAIAQRDFKRLMAFSSVAHAGYLLLGMLCMTPAGYAAAMFYGAAVLVMKYTCFMVMTRVAEDGGNLQIDELAGLHRRSPLLALALMMALFSLGGIPPTIGFSGKLIIFVAAMQKGYLVLVIIAMTNVVISLYYYLLVLKAAYLDEPTRSLPVINLTIPSRLVAVAMIVLIVGIGFYPTALLDLMQAAVLRLP
ncbi:NADH-quinone oxidoreductase subunit N [uncultured Desulfosarcina sp.]|uniref:NADH-quinone oxidoreductase subunit N n=1 Tax=uncultured Desulfosarcina sp. TaxID=218289 RepID=UPI0029C7C488|nr:NADH-quinone oxidoreductase subunit N [uncultured Desulfosarcina sp.]